jgi:hypothetical protein
MGYSADHQSVISSAAAASSNNWAGNSQQQQQRAVESEPIQMYLLTRDDQPFCCNICQNIGSFRISTLT